MPTIAAAYIDNRVGNPLYKPWCQSATQANPKYVCRTDNATLTWWAQSPIDTTTSANDTAAETAINATLSGSYNGTDLNVSHASSPVYSGSAETDIIYTSNPSGFVTGDDGYTWCDNVAAPNSFKCDQQYVNFRYTSTTRPLACHETGHAVGLLHGANSNPTTGNQTSALQCMKKSVSSDDWHLGSNNTTSINNMY